MLVANIGKGKESFTITSRYSREELVKIKKKTEFTCPQCQETLILRIGQIKTPHFSHKSSSSCVEAFSERESEVHLLGKLQLYEFFNRQNGKAQLEAYLPYLQQRPDILFEDKNSQYHAIEFQCSTIAEQLFMTRTNGYKSHEVQPHWILLSPTIKNYSQQSIIQIRLTSFQQLFIRNMTAQRFLISYNPHEKAFIYFSNLLPLLSNQFLAIVQKLPIQHQKFPFYEPTNCTMKQLQTMMMKYSYTKNRYVKNRLFLSRKGVNDPLLRSIYELRLNRNKLPLYLGVPTKNSHLLSVSPIEWQTSLFYFSKKHQLQLNELHHEAIIRFLHGLNIVITENNIQAVFHYISWLRSLNIISINDEIPFGKLIESLYDHLVAL